jgi:hypothetical protein
MKRALATLGLLAAAGAAGAQSGNNLEIIHHPNYDKSVFMPFSPAIKIRSGKILWLAGGTALPVYHDHPHKREQVLQYLQNDLEAQTRRTMDGIMQTPKSRSSPWWTTERHSVGEMGYVPIFLTRRAGIRESGR